MRAKAKRQCRGKAKMPAHEAHRIHERLTALGEHMDVYQCPHCGAWHLGHPNTEHRRQAHERKKFEDFIAAQAQQARRRRGRG